MELDGFIEIFNPGHKHLREERDRKRLEAQIPATAGPPFGIDLDGGVAHIRLRQDAQDGDRDSRAAGREPGRRARPSRDAPAGP